MSRYIDSNLIVQTACGPLQGVASTDGITAFKGVRYATARRFAKPQPVTHWDGLYNATEFGDACSQARTYVPESSFYGHEFREGTVFSYSEDCLFLNIYVPENAEQVPVLFYIHGGAFAGGAGNEKHFDPRAWCRKGVIAVTINYRLGVFGFSNFEAARTHDTCGNYGLFDQLAALNWVKDHISSFGGDPNRITIMGQSAGAMSVQQLCLSPLSEGLFAGAVMLSGGGLVPMMNPRPAKETFAAWNKFAESLGAKTLEELQAIPTDDLAKAYLGVMRTDPALMCAPLIDGHFIVASNNIIARTEGSHPVPYIIGSTGDDMACCLLHKAVKEFADLQQEQNAPSVYGFFFDRDLPGDDRGSWHSSDLWYWFGSLHNSWRPMTAWDDTLSEAMVTYLCNFATAGNPNDTKQELWMPLAERQGKVMHFGNDHIGMLQVDEAALEEKMRRQNPLF
ncbi:MAG: carboxylesterase family protein [Clostridia bacterium]|nr:carboxylesterase family protein [Clostridia bacterium]